MTPDQGLHPAVKARPWHTPYDPEDPTGSAWGEYAAWERWMSENLDGMLPAYAESVFDKIDCIDRTYLYALMCKLADGDFAPEGVPS